MREGLQAIAMRVEEARKRALGIDIIPSPTKIPSPTEILVVSDPQPVITKGGGKRLKLSKERSVAHQIRQCSECKSREHNRRTCPTLRPQVMIESLQSTVSSSNTFEQHRCGG